MARKVTLSNAADADLEAVSRWLDQVGAGQRAANRRRRIVEAIKDLRRHPCRWPSIDHIGVRERPVEGYTIFYEIKPDTGSNATAGDVRILRVFGPFQDRSRF